VRHSKNKQPVATKPVATKPVATKSVVKNLPRIAIVDSQPTCRIGLSHYIKKLGRWEIAWASSTAEEAMEKIAKDQPHLIILEIELHGKDGLEFIKHLRPLYPDLRILVHSAHDEEFYAERCIRAGASGYFHKMEPMGRFERALETVLAGELFLNSRITRQTIEALAGRNGKNGFDSSHVHGLTDRELEILQLIAKGHSCQDTADKLHISPRTVQVHRNNIRLKIGLDSALQLHAYAIRFCQNEECGHCRDNGE
jgi:DNA-binding NarL/FixJ family response regulator